MSSVIQLQHPLTGPALAETLDGGQCFRWRRTEAGAWDGVSGGLAAHVYPRSDDAVAADLISGTAADLRRHMADDMDWHALADRLPWRTDAHLARCMAAFPGLRILRQPIGETLLCFLCSATKQIVQIKQMVALLATRLGDPLPPSQCQLMVDTAQGPGREKCQLMVDTGSGGGRSADAKPRRSEERGRGAHAPAGAEARPAVHALPTWDRLARVSEKELRGCLLGFRARHVAGVASYLAERPGWLQTTAALPYREAKARLMELPGVGEKIADCVLLFGTGKLEAFPVDVWILRVMEQRYGLQGWRPEQIAHFGRTHFGPLAGLAQQYLFAWERQAARAAKAP